MNNRTAAAKAAQPATPVNFDMPAGACDCHTHIHPDPAEIPVLRRPRLYARTGLAGGNDRPAQGAAHGARGDRHALRSTAPTTRRRCSAWRRAGPTARGVAVIDDKTSESDLDADGQGRHSRRPPQPRNRRRQRSERRPAAVYECGRAHEGARLARADLYQHADDHGGQGSDHGLAGAGRVRSFRRRTGGARRRAAGLCRPRGSRQGRQGLCEDLRRLPRLEARRPITPTASRSPRR